MEGPLHYWVISVLYTYVCSFIIFWLIYQNLQLLFYIYFPHKFDKSQYRKCHKFWWISVNFTQNSVDLRNVKKLNADKQYKMVTFIVNYYFLPNITEKSVNILIYNYTSYFKAKANSVRNKILPPVIK